MCSQYFPKVFQTFSNMFPICFQISISLSVCFSMSVARPSRENQETNRGALEWATLSCRGRFWIRFTLRVLFYVGGPAWPAFCSSSSSSSPTPLYSFNCGRLEQKGHDRRVRILAVNDNWFQNKCIMHDIGPQGSELYELVSYESYEASRRQV